MPTLTIPDVSPEVIAALEAEARARGTTVESIARARLQRAADDASLLPPQTPLRRWRTWTSEQIEEMERREREAFDRLPPQPDEFVVSDDQAWDEE